MLKLLLAGMVGAGSFAAVSAATLGGSDGSKSERVMEQSKPEMETVRGFQIHSVDSAPAASKEVLRWYVDNFQFVPNLAGVMADSPALSRSYWELTKNLQAGGELTPPEDNIVQLAIAVDNECQYCVAGGTMAGKVFFKTPEAQLEALRTESKLSDKKFEALRSFALDVYHNRGRVSDSALQSFLDAGYSRRAALEVVANVSAKVMTNFTNQIALTPVDDMIKPFTEGLSFQEDREIVER